MILVVPIPDRHPMHLVVRADVMGTEDKQAKVNIIFKTPCRQVMG